MFNSKWRIKDRYKREIQIFDLVFVWEKYLYFIYKVVVIIRPLKSFSKRHGSE